MYTPRTQIFSGYQDSLGYGFATALGAKVAHPDRAVVCITGDGGFLFTMPELATAVRALDRVLRHGYYAVPHWYSNTFRVAYRGGRFMLPAPPSFYRPEQWALSCWWSR